MTQSLRLFRTVNGTRTAVAFSTPARLTTVLGTDQRWIHLSESALRRMVDDLHLEGIVVDPSGSFSGRTAEHQAA
ncbi:SAV_915 family protein [Sphaerisporangium corydalis]|uniref:SAV_915 family protein n=1 Tax=Sphaerisporangium corydalis TaxID=1441875 RepID=A0ABV9E8S7_9ACTN|nr:SAV_915 family protein [Sphaerisporangium corydalis]